MKNNHSKKGKVILVGAGPGDEGLLTLKGKEMLLQADVVVYDWLVNPEILKFAPQAEKIFVGKTGNVGARRAVPLLTQDAINQILLKLARNGKFVVRLKGGDPFIFGRGGEEASFLRDHRIPFEVVPGISAGIGAPAYAGIPLTDRRFASQVTFITGHEDPSKIKSITVGARFPRPKSRGAETAPLQIPAQGTLVFFMGVSTLPQIIRNVINSGRSISIPIALIEWGTLPQQRVVIGTLKDIVPKAKKMKIESPALAVIGDVVKLRNKLAWYSAKRRGEKKPLAGKTVLVTRSRAQASELSEKLKEKGADVLEFPTIQIEPPSDPQLVDQQIKIISQYDWVVFTSVNGVQFFFERMKRLKKDARIFSGVQIAAIGPATAQALNSGGLNPDIVPEDFTSESLFRSLKAAGEIRGKKFLLARADIAPPDLRKALEKEGAEVKELEAYRTRPVSVGATHASPLQAIFQDDKIDYITFTSSSTVRNFFDLLPSKLRKRIKSRLVSIGPVTSRTIREYGFKPNREAKIHTLEGLVETICNGGHSK